MYQVSWLSPGLYHPINLVWTMYIFLLLQHSSFKISEIIYNGNKFGCIDKLDRLMQVYQLNSYDNCMNIIFEQSYLFQNPINT